MQNNIAKSCFYRNSRKEIPKWQMNLFSGDWRFGERYFVKNCCNIQYRGGERMTLFKQLKKLIASGQRQIVEKDVADPHGTVRNSEPSFFSGTSGIAEKEKRKRVSQLTPREYELYRLLLEGLTLKESAKQLSVKYSTANTHMTGIYRKLGVRSRAQLIINYRSINEDRVQTL